MQPTALIVEDDDALRKLFVVALALEGFRVVEASDGLEALQLVEKDPPDLIVLDLGLPYLSGHEVLSEIRAHGHTRDIPIVVATASTENLDHLDVACVVRKPVTLETLTAVVRRCFEG
jgi:CheY-like chemotaxis protein